MLVDKKGTPINVIKLALAFLGLGSALFIFTVITSAQQAPLAGQVQLIIMAPAPGSELRAQVPLTAQANPKPIAVNFKIYNPATQLNLTKQAIFDPAANLWNYIFNSVEVPDGDYVLLAEAIDPPGNSQQVQVTVKNQIQPPPPPPDPIAPIQVNVQVVRPLDMEGVVGLFDIIASTSAPVSSMGFTISAQGTAAINVNGQVDTAGMWHAQWDSTTVANGSYQVVATGRVDQNSYSSQPRNFSVANVLVAPIINTNTVVNEPTETILPPPPPPPAPIQPPTTQTNTNTTIVVPPPIVSTVRLTNPAASGSVKDILRFEALTDVAAEKVAFIITFPSTNGTTTPVQFQAQSDAARVNWFFGWDSRQFANGLYKIMAVAESGGTQVRSGSVEMSVENAAQAPITFETTNTPLATAPTLVNTGTIEPAPAPIPIQEVIPSECEKLGITDPEQCRKVITSISEENKVSSTPTQSDTFQREVVPIQGRTVVLAPSPEPIDSASEIKPLGARPGQPALVSPERPPLLAFQTPNSGTILVNPQELAPNVLKNRTPLNPTEPVAMLLLPSVETRQIVSDTEIYEPPVVVAIDSDKDGLPDDVERRLGTDANTPDTDGDGFGDFLEVQSGHDPLQEGDRDLNLSPIDRAIIARVAIEQPKFSGETDDRNFKVESVDNSSIPAAGSAEGRPVLKFKGRGRPNTVVTLYLYSPVAMVLTINTDENGDFEYTLDQPLSDGVHQVYVTVTNETGKIEKKSNPLSFFVKEARAANEEDFFRPDVNIQQTSAAALNYYMLAAVGLVIIASLFVLRVYWKKIHSISNGS